MNLVDGIAPSVQFGSRMHASKIALLDSEIPYVREIFLMIYDSLVFVSTYFVILLCFEVAKKTRNEKLCNLAVEIRLDML